MSALRRVRSNNSSKRKSFRQKQYRRKTNMMKKASEYSKMCDADVCIGIRIRETGQIHILSADTSGFWAFLPLQLGSYYPTPTVMTDRDLKKAKEDTASKDPL
uniref:HhpM n=1 Tax=Byssochlamys spectabilis TaxID=264951 RepID=A0A7M4CBV2_BYSSP|nr:HhpM [Paecilomyces variotii]